jgi:predicted ester cyclase
MRRRSRTPVEAVCEAVETLNGGDIEGYLSAFAPSCLRTVPGMPDALPLAEIGESLDGLRAAFDGIRLEAVVLFGDSRYVCARWLMNGTHTGDYFGIPATGRSVAVETCEVYEFDGGQVIASWAYGDPLELLRQIGALPETTEQ